MKITNIILPIEFNHFTGGMIHSVMDLAEALTAKYNVYLLAHQDSEVLKYSNKIKPLVLDAPWSISITSPLKTLKTYLQVKNLLEGFDRKDTIIFTNNVGSELIFSGFGVFPLPYQRVFVSRGGNYSGRTGFILKKGFRTVSKFIATSRHQLDILQERGIDRNKITIIHNGIDIATDDFKYSLNKSAKIQLSIIGYISSNKNQIMAVEVLHWLVFSGYDVELNIFGIAFSSSDQEYELLLKSKINELELKDRVVFHGYKVNLIQIYAHTDFLLSCSLAEGFGRVVVEGMAFGVPCVGLKRSGGLQDIVTNGVDGFLVENNRKAMANVIENLILDTKLKSFISKNAIATYKNKFTKSVMVKNYFNFLKTFE